jgi:hypothetical protein
MNLVDFLVPGTQIKVALTYPEDYEVEDTRTETVDLKFWFTRGNLVYFDAGIFVKTGQKAHKSLALDSLREMHLHPDGGWSGVFDDYYLRNGEEIGPVPGIDPDPGESDPVFVRVWVTTYGQAQGSDQP